MVKLKLNREKVAFTSNAYAEHTGIPRFSIYKKKFI